MSVQAQPVGNLKERIAALQQRSVSAPQQGQQQSSSNSKASSPGLRSKIAKFESKGGVPIPRGSFGLGAPPDGGQNASRELYGNRIPSVNKPNGSVSRSGSPLPGVDGSPGASDGKKRRLSAGTIDTSPGPGNLDLSGVLQKLAYQRNLDILNGTPTDTSSSPGSDHSKSPSEPTGNDTISTSARRRSMQVPGASRRSASVDLLSRYSTQPEPIDMKQAAPSIVISSEPSSATSIIEGSQIVDEPLDVTASSPLTSRWSKPGSPSSPKAPSPTVGISPTIRTTAGAEHSPVTSPVSPASTIGVVQTGVKVGHEHPPDSPYLEFAKPSSPPGSPEKVQAPIPRKVTSPTRSKTKAEAPNAIRPTRTSSLAPVPRPSRSPSPTPSMIHRPGTAESEAVSTASKSRNRKSSHARRTVVELPANPPPVPDNEEPNIYGSVTLGSHSETNLLDAVQRTKPVFTAVVHRKVTESPRSSPPSDARSVRSVPNLTSHARRAMRSVPPISPGSGDTANGDLAALLAEAALLEERLQRGETAGDLTHEIDQISDPFHLEPLSVPSITTPETHNDEIYDHVPPPPPPKGFPRMLSGFKKLTGSGSLRSITGSHSRRSTSGSELSSEDSASVGTPSDNGIPFPGSRSNGSIDRASSSGSSALGFNYPSAYSKKNSGSMSRASSFAEKIWHRSRTKSNNSNAASSRKHLPLPVSTVHSKAQPPRSSTTLPPTLPPILTPGDTPDDQSTHRPVSWQSLSSTVSTNTTSTISPGGHLFSKELFDAFPSVPQQVPHVPPDAGSTNYLRTSYDIGRSATLPPSRTRGRSAQKLA